MFKTLLELLVTFIVKQVQPKKIADYLEGTVMQIEKVLINDRLRVSKVSWKFRIPTIYNFAVIYSWNLLSS